MSLCRHGVEAYTHCVICCKIQDCETCKARMNQDRKHRWSSFLTSRAANCLFRLYSEGYRKRWGTDKEFHKLLRYIDFDDTHEAEVMDIVKEDILNGDIVLKRVQNCGRETASEILEWCGIIIPKVTSKN